MQVISINVGLPRAVAWRGEVIQTSIFKEPIVGSVAIERLNVEGDRQADLSVHGGAEKAVYAYPAEHYEYWRRELPDADLPWGTFGENFTTTGLAESDLHIGDRLRVGTAELIVTQPRMPCFKLALRFGRPDMVKRFLQSGRTGFYLAVAREGTAAAGDTIVIAESDASAITVSDVVRLYTTDAENQELLRRATGAAALPQGWRDYFRKRLWTPDE